MTQAETIRLHLRRHRTITPLHALRTYGIYRVADPIHKLRKRGMPIVTEIASERGKKFAKYRLLG